MKKVCSLIVPIVVAAIACSCQQTPSPVQSYSGVSYAGALRNIMHKGDLSSQITIDTALLTKAHYGLGAVAGLDGEILVWDGLTLISRVDSSQKVAISSPSQIEASLYVYSDVPEWKQINLPDTIQSLESFEAYLGRSVSVDSAFPFLIRGEVEKLEWHVIQWDLNDTIHTHDKHKNSGATGQIVSEAVDILGFYSRHHKGIFTHHSRFLHMHFRAKSGMYAGHVDDVRLSSDVAIFVPAELELLTGQ
jgi:acetolactate decarboxylase